MKQFKSVKLEAVNNPSGSYAAGCPEATPGAGGCWRSCMLRN
jgi:hypothetical protein